MLSLEELIREISEKSGKSEEEISSLIKDKQAELSNLVSEEGAAYIVGREAGVELIKDTRRKLKIKNILADMRNVEVVARIASVFEPREFDKNGKKGIVSGVMLSDDTGAIRLPLWNDEANLVSTLGLSQGDLVEISGAWAKKDNYRDAAELRLGKRGRIKKLEDGKGGDVPVLQEGDAGPPAPAEAKRVEIKDVSPGLNVIVKGCLMQVYRKRPYFEACPQCGGRVEEAGGSFTCKEHGTVQPAFNLLLSGVIDDGTGNIRAVFFREQAGKLFGKSAEDIKESFESEGMEAFWGNFAGRGKEFMVEGRVKISDFSQEPEILANKVSEVNVKEEAESLLKEIGG
jgi:ssDNA-binding replication factor A large subunit